MVYRRTEKVSRRLAQRRAAILAAAREIADENGLQAVQIARVATRAGIAAGTMYRYFPSKTELVCALVSDVCEEMAHAMQAAAVAAPGPLSALAGALTALAAAVAVRPRLLWAIMAEPADPLIGEMRRRFRASLADGIAARIKAAAETGHLPDQNARVSALALIGALVEALAGPLSDAAGEENARRDRVRALTLVSLRAVGVLDARARGLVVQAALPAI